ncbi:hypothetical protein PHMEG_0006124 [Phytophthora megakarya]|uniref:Uncharacterized protein n=1 Tax=Phytophthora megakarya TaxID=4795 RepID=A0A225WPX1_9STRA|nr:hypothetical protein PHMEG_0006124 [Phytophthora megakarya]
MVIDKGHSTEYDNAPQECQLLPNKKRETKPSALLDSVLTLPTFDDNSFLKKRKSHPHFPGTHRINQRAKPKPAPAQSFTIKHQEYAVGYPNSTVNAIQVRCDGSAIARWSSGTVAVSVDFETSSDHCGYRVYAAHKDGQLALSFDPTGVGFLNAYPSGKTLLSTTSDGNGLLFDIGTGAILRQWDAHGRLRDGMSQSAEALGDESDGSLLCRLSEHLAVRVSLVRSQRVLHEFTDNVDQDCVNPISLQIYFAGAPGIRHVFVNSANRAEHCSEGACDYALGKVLSKVDTTKPVKAKKPMEHNELLNNIRAAVASL